MKTKISNAKQRPYGLLDQDKSKLLAILNLDLFTQNYSGYVRPFTINVHTDATEGTSPTAESANRGFCLNYVQQPCNAPTG